MRTKLTTGERIDDLLSECGESVTDAAKHIGVSASMLSEIRNTDCSTKKERKIGSESLTKLCKYFGVSADYLLGLTEVRSLDTSVQAVHKATGLSEKAIENLQSISGYDAYDTLSRLLETEDFIESIKRVAMAADIKVSPYARRMEQWKAEGIAPPDINEQQDYDTFDNSIKELSEMSPNFTMLSREDTVSYHLTVARDFFYDAIRKLI